uniref:Uncharacterized protein n=1 Tax=Thermosporothrix sp. COM3 TaxID=2490863 RepID=A0A455SIF9_9CHLR|nr:hypothetical protein KTC_21010 [Thermosporothrix sp. COM3]
MYFSIYTRANEEKLSTWFRRCIFSTLIPYNKYREAENSNKEAFSDGKVELISYQTSHLEITLLLQASLAPKPQDLGASRAHLEEWACYNLNGSRSGSHDIHCPLEQA